MNIISDMNQAWSDKENSNSDQYADYIRNLLSYGFNACQKVLSEFLKDKYNDEMIFITQILLIKIILSDNVFMEGEYKAYSRICYWAEIDPFTVSECRKIYNKVTSDELKTNIKILDNFRDIIGEKLYHTFVLSLCYLTLAGDKELDASEYYILREFYSRSNDYAPKTWDEFNKEWV